MTLNMDRCIICYVFLRCEYLMKYGDKIFEVKKDKVMWRVWERRGGAQGLAGETGGKETTWETKAQMGG